MKQDYQIKLSNAQSELDNRMNLYYRSNADGGCHDEIYKIMLCIARKYEVDVNDLIA